MSEIKVRLLADAQSLLDEANDAVTTIEGRMPTLKLQADSTEFLAGVQTAIQEAEKLQATMKLTGVGSPPGAIPGSVKGAGGMPGMGSGHNSSSQDPYKGLLDYMRYTQTQQSKQTESLIRAIEELTRTTGKNGRVNPNQGNGQNGSVNGSGDLNSILRYLNMRPSGAGGQLTASDVIGTRGGGIAGLLSSIPGLGGIGSAMSGAGLITWIASIFTKQAQTYEQARDRATAVLSDTYDVFGRTGAFNPENYGGNLESYTFGEADLANRGIKYGYGIDEVLRTSDELMSSGGFTTIENFRSDIESAMATSRVTGVDTSAMAEFIGSAVKYGYANSGDGGRITDQFVTSVAQTGMRGREDEMLDVMKKQLEKLGDMNSHMTDSAMENWQNVYQATIEKDAQLKGQRGAEAVESAEDFLNDPTDMMMLRLAGYDGGGIQGVKETMMKMAEDPTGTATAIAQNLGSMGFTADDLTVMGVLSGKLDGKKISATSTAMQALFEGGKHEGIDARDTEAIRTYSQTIKQDALDNYDATVGLYAKDELRWGEAQVGMGQDDLNLYRRTMEERQAWDRAKWTSELDMKEKVGVAYNAGKNNNTDNPYLPWQVQQTIENDGNYVSAYTENGEVDERALAYARSRMDNMLVEQEQYVPPQAPDVLPVGYDALTGEMISQQTEEPLAPKQSAASAASRQNDDPAAQSRSASSEGYGSDYSQIPSVQAPEALSLDIDPLTGQPYSASGQSSKASGQEADTGDSSRAELYASIRDAVSAAVAMSSDPGARQSVSEASIDEVDPVTGTTYNGTTLMQNSGGDYELQNYAELLAHNNDELKKNTAAIESATGGDGITAADGLTAAVSAQDQSGLTVNAQRDAYSNSRSVQSSMTRVQDAMSMFGTGSPNMLLTAANAVHAVVQQSAQDPSGKNGTAVNAEPTIANVAADTATPNATGNDYVPYDGYPATLHKGEMVLRRDDADLFRQGRLGESDSLVRDNMFQYSIVDRPEDERIGNVMSMSAVDLNAGTALDSFLNSTSAVSQQVSFDGGDINININVTGQVEGMDQGMQRQIVDSVQAQLAGAGLRDMISSGFTRRQNW